MITKARFDELYAKVAGAISWWTLNLSAINDIKAGHIEFGAEMFAKNASEQVHLLSDLVLELHKEIEKDPAAGTALSCKG